MKGTGLLLLYLVQHAKAGKEDEDSSRPLSGKGYTGC